MLPPLVFHDGVQSVPHRVTPVLSAEGISFTAGNTPTLWRWDDVKVENWPSGATPAMLSHRDTPDARLVIPPDAWPLFTAAYTPLAKGHPHARPEFMLSVALAGLLALGILFFGLPPLLDRFALVAPRAWEDEAGELFAASLFGDKLCPANPAADAALARVMKKVGEAHETYRIVVVDNPHRNAYTLPGGRVYILSGLLAQAKSPNELAAVLAHEAGHVHYRHSFRFLVKEFGLTLALTLASQNGGSGGVPADIMHALLALQNSRGAETEADTFAIRALQEKNIDPSAFAAFLQSEERAQKKAGEDVPEWLSTHPATDARIALIKSLSAARKGKNSSYINPIPPQDWRAITSYCRKNPA